MVDILQRQSFDREEVEDCSLGILEMLEEEGVDRSLGQVAVALTLGRLLSPNQPMESEDGLAFVQSILEWTKLYFTPTGVTH